MSEKASFGAAAAVPSAAERVMKLACDAGFDLYGIASAEAYPELSHLREWLDRGYAGEMKYLNDARRENSAQVFEAARSAIVVGLSYNRPQPYSTQVAPTNRYESPRGWISRYAWGDDYHDVLLHKLQELIGAMRQELHEEFQARAYVDTGPIHERAAGHHAGLGWLGKNTLLINEHLGSWFFLGVIVTDLDLAASASVQQRHELPPDLCGTCTLCIDACPTGAIVEPYVLDARRCISYLSIELRGSIPEELRIPMGRMVYGCDICQDVCPWNHKAPNDAPAAFEPRPLAARPDAAQHESLFAPLLESIAALTEEQYRNLFRGSAMRRAKWRGLARNACVALGNSKIVKGTPAYERVTALLRDLDSQTEPLIAEHARWALERLTAQADKAL